MLLNTAELSTFEKDCEQKTEPTIMQQLILKKDIEQSKLDALLHFLKSYNIEVELKTNAVVAKKKNSFSLSVGLWKKYSIEATELRTDAWNRKK